MVISGQTFFTMMISAANALDNDKVVINNMNIFPVPDGDTGINMSLTMSAIKILSRFDGTIADCAEKASGIILRAARGNSGAILSLFFRGMSKSMKGLEFAGSHDLAAAFRRGTTEAYKAVMKPTEGTILTIMRSCAEKAEAVADKYSHDLVAFFSSILRAAEEALAKTPEQLPVLKEVNLVDAGGYGFVTILKGMLAALQAHPIVAKDTSSQYSANVFEEFTAEDIRFAYCTECIVEKSEEYKGEGSADSLREFIYGIGDSAVFVDDEEIIKLHVHTNNPGLVMEEALKFGMLITVKVENMRKQHTEIIEKAPEDSVEEKAAISKKYGFVSVCMGSGISDTFRDLGADEVIFGGQTMNPSTQDIIDGIDKTPAEHIFVLPNNKNIYMVAEQAAKLITDKKVHVLPTKSVPQGISAMLVFDPESEVEDCLSAMNEAIGAVTSMSITQAVRDTTLDGEKIESGQFLGMLNGAIFCVEDSIKACFEKLSVNAEGKTFINLFYGEDASEEEANEISALLLEKADKYAEVNVISGGQPLYPYIISLE
ncbi:MAG: DAK2 domain-containing protein [Ruminococcaceae bacterium]|nr:DAK2 domain-containing protein [Oscillospiraceae bacterium]